ncbi:hypothetical protein DFJ73DRAFT_836445 [Zopfochytrium polystomum]|nr:hypothetical protein DFJ73DRAFT_836445 [Zopfochytrium polystomum]
MVSASSLLSAVLVLAAAAASGVDAHVKWLSPTPRGTFNEALEVLPPCGGQALGSRTTFPIENGTVKFTSFHATAVVNFTLAVSPTASYSPLESDFNIPYGPGVATYSPKGTYTTAPFNLTGLPGVVPGAFVTLRMIYDGGDSNLYQCADVVIA